MRYEIPRFTPALLALDEALEILRNADAITCNWTSEHKDIATHLEHYGTADAMIAGSTTPTRTSCRCLHLRMDDGSSHDFDIGDNSTVVMTKDGMEFTGIDGVEVLVTPLKERQLERSEDPYNSMRTITLETNYGKIFIDMGEPAEDGQRSGSIDCSALPHGMAFDGITSLVLAHACAGVDVESDYYVTGINSALDAAANHTEETWEGDEHEDWPLHEWRHDVNSGDTRLGYAEWVSHNLQLDEHPIFSDPIRNTDGAVLLLDYLFENGLDFHPDDDPFDTHAWEFSDVDCRRLRKRMDEIRKLPFDPCSHYLRRMRQREPQKKPDAGSGRQIFEFVRAVARMLPYESDEYGRNPHTTTPPDGEDAMLVVNRLITEARKLTQTPEKP